MEMKMFVQSYAIDLYKNSESYTLQLEVPGVLKDDLKVTVDKDVIHIVKDTKSKESIDESEFIYLEKQRCKKDFHVLVHILKDMDVVEFTTC